MANIAISELSTEATTLNDNDLLLVSKNNGTSYVSAKMKASVLKNSSSGTSDITSEIIQAACEKAITNKNVVTKNVIENTISQSFINSDVIDEKLSNVSSRGNFIDLSQAIEFKTTLTTSCLPFDCLLVWSTVPSTITINFFDAKSVLSMLVNKQYYIESGSDVMITPNQSSCYLIPLSYGSTQLEYVTNDITDWLVDGAGRSEIDEHFTSISVYGGNSSSISNNTQYTKMSQIEGLNCKYWTIYCKPKSNMIIASGGKKQRNAKYNHDYYVSGNYVHNSTFTNSAGATTNSGKRVFVKTDQYLTMTFMGYNTNSTAISTFPATFFNNIQWAEVGDLTIA